MAKNMYGFLSRAMGTVAKQGDGWLSKGKGG